MFWRFALRDALILSLCLACWAVYLRWEGTGLLGVLAALPPAVLTFVAGLVFHEWGHLAGARLAAAPVSAPPRLASPFVFYFDGRRASGPQFVAMSVGGFATSLLYLLVLLVLLPLGTLAGKLALGFAVAGLVATLILEVPAAWRVARGAPLPLGPGPRD